MTANTSIDPSLFLHEQLAQASPDLMRELLGTFLNALLSAQADSVCGAEYGTRSDDRTNRRNGYRHRDLDTRAGTLDVAVPKLREGSVVGLLECDGAEHADRTVQPTVVVPLDPSGRCELDIGEGPVGARVEDRGANALRLVQAVAGLHEGVVVRVADRPDRGGDLLEVQVLGEPDRDVLGRFRGSMQHRPARLRLAARRRPPRESSSRGTCVVGR